MQITGSKYVKKKKWKGSNISYVQKHLSKLSKLSKLRVLRIYSTFLAKRNPSCQFQWLHRQKKQKHFVLHLITYICTLITANQVAFSKVTHCVWLTPYREQRFRFTSYSSNKGWVDKPEICEIANNLRKWMHKTWKFKFELCSMYIIKHLILVNFSWSTKYIVLMYVHIVRIHR